ncbi:hypothetical protein SPRG_13461 [Saprolegnia parasitica CBS 223.65]|uniref:Uncharacterized protein n=1 Tax=Saprolegnia parasitica (strain CBS 223.65) TaxID=695850 RepID=A0A067C094_SAPPC|nr:hypothetical protein SPRG_13461 [Saprolegnia parasitica CBS 223.65]KDO20207.1 hypothetical protein SPRG_13461 [Saprolegnia parasitica CBS 223.65]|eukprot:XP_012209094.1 hypothetical protein SPRG_13461 [Saprolegnia parasitica CBS 223.65]
MMYFFPLKAVPARKPRTSKLTTTTATGAWSPAEHKRFLVALEKYPSGPWKTIAAHVGTRTPRQAQTHAQKYREKLVRKLRCPSNDGNGCMMRLVKDEMASLPDDDPMELEALTPLKLEASADLRPLASGTDDTPSLTFEDCLDFFIREMDA